MANSPNKLKKIHWSIKGSIVAVFVAAFAFLNFIFSVNFSTYSINYDWLFAFVASCLFFVICSIAYINSLEDD